VARLLPGPVAAQHFGINPTRIRVWKTRGLIAPAGLDARNRPLYDYAELARLIHRMQPREAAA